MLPDGFGNMNRNELHLHLKMNSQEHVANLSCRTNDTMMQLKQLFVNYASARLHEYDFVAEEARHESSVGQGQGDS